MVKFLLKMFKESGVAGKLIITGYLFTLIETAYFGFNKHAGSQAEVIADFIGMGFIIAGIVCVCALVYRSRSTRPLVICEEMVGRSFYAISGEPTFAVVTVVSIKGDDVRYVVGNEVQVRQCSAKLFLRNARFLPMNEQTTGVDQRFAPLER